MREINSNINKVPNAGLKQDKIGKQEPQLCAESEGTSIKDFSNPKAESLGRSQVSKTDNLKADIAFAMANPETIERSDKLFNMALAKLEAENDRYSYEKACSIATSEDAKAIL